MNNNKNEPLDELNKVIKKVAGSDEFKEILGGISNKILSLGTDLDKEDISSIKSENTDEFSTDDDTQTETDNSLINLMHTYFMSKNGNNICDCLDNLNTNIKKIIDTKKNFTCTNKHL